MLTLTACSVYSDNTTPPSANVPGSRAYPISVDLKRDAFVISNSIRARVFAGEDAYPMNGSGGGTWNFGLPILCRSTPFNYNFRINWKYLALFFPVSENRRDPATGFFSASFTPLPPVRIMPPELLMYGEASGGVLTRTVEIQSQSLGTLTITDISIVTASGFCGVGVCSGSNFSISSAPSLPLLMKCGDEATINIAFGSTIQSSGQLRINTDMGTYNVPLSGKLFL